MRCPFWLGLIGEGRMNGHHNGNGYKGWARRQARRRNGHG